MWGAIAGAAASVAGPLIGKALGGGKSGGGQGISQEMLDYLREINVPSVQDRLLDLGRYSSVGKLSPEAEEDILMGRSRFEDIMSPQETVDAQMSALRDFGEIADKEGYDAQAMAAYDELRNRLRGELQGNTENIRAEMARRGMSGSGLEAASRLSANQAAAQASGTEAVQIASQAEQRALDALKSKAELAGEIRGQSFDEQSRIADALDAIQKFNVQSRQDVQQRNVGARNVAQEYNLSRDQDIANMNVGQADREETARRRAYEQTFQDQLAKGQTMSGQARDVATRSDAAAAAESAAAAGIGKGISQAGTAIGQYLSGRKKDEE